MITIKIITIAIRMLIGARQKLGDNENVLFLQRTQALFPYS